MHKSGVHHYSNYTALAEAASGMFQAAISLLVVGGLWVFVKKRMHFVMKEYTLTLHA
jgi:hypothetical protein